MLYCSNATLPISVRHRLPPRAQDVYREAFNGTWAVHAGDAAREEHASRVAWAAVKQRYHLVPGGSWHETLPHGRAGHREERP